MAESRDWAAVCIAPVIRRETSSPFQVVPVHKESPGRITASFEGCQALGIWLFGVLSSTAM